VAEGAARSRLEVAWYGGGRRRVEVVTGVSNCYKSGAALVPVCWVFVRDRSGTHRDDFLFTTDIALSPRQVIEEYTGRWSIEATFQECRAYLGLGTTRGWSRGTVLRAEPCLLGLYTIVAALYSRLPPGGPGGLAGGVAGEGADGVLRRHHRRQAVALGGLGFCGGGS
jgi:hypothetical protein